MPFLTFFENTGYNAVNGPLPNSPASKALNIGGTGETVYPGGQIEIEDIYDPIHLSQVSVPARAFAIEAGLDVIDYMRLDMQQYGGSYFYSVTDWRYSSSDVIIFQLLLDPFQTFQIDRSRLVYYSGLKKVHLPNGIVRRVNTPEVMTSPGITDDLYRLTAPPVYHVDAIDHPGTAEFESVKLIALAVDPENIAKNDLVATITEIASSTDGTQVQKLKAGENINVPRPSIITFNYPPLNGSITGAGKMKYNTEGYSLFLLRTSESSPDLVIQAANKMLALNMADAIIGAYEIPRTMCTTKTHSSSWYDRIDIEGRASFYSTPFKPRALYPDMPWAEIMYACPEYTFTLAGSCSGDTLTDAAVNCDGNVYRFVDPRPDGRPYYILTRKTQIATTNIEQTIAALQSRAIAGAPWQPVAITLKGAAGADFAALSTTIAQQRIRDNLDTVTKQYSSPGLSFVSSLNGMVGMNDKGGISVGNPSGVISSGISAIAQAFTNPELYRNPFTGAGPSEQDMAWISPIARAKQQAGRALIDEALSFASRYGYVTPTIKSQPQTSLQQAIGNGAVFTAQVPSTIDMARFGHIFAMFGRACSIVIGGDVELKPAETAPCVFVQEEVADVGGGMARQLMRDRLANGYRFWIQPGKGKDFGDPADYWEVSG